MALGLALGLVSACSSNGTGGGDKTTTQEGKDGAPSVSITPSNLAKNAEPDKGVTVTAAGGTLSRVTVTYKGRPVPGALSDDKTTWRSTWTLTPGGRYQVAATATGAKGKTTDATSSFQADKHVAATTISQVIPATGEKVGVGMPILVQFSKAVPVKARPAVEKALEITSTHPTEGAWRWLSAGESFNGLPSVAFRPRKPWKANQKVTITAHYAGLRIGDAVFGDKDVKHTFTIGDAHTITVNAKTDKLVVRKNGKVVRSWGVSLGSGGDVQADGVDHLLTTSGVHLTMNKSRLERMRPPGKKEGDPGWYDEKVPWAYRISNSGEYIHQNMDDPSCLGNRNCSHGCVRSPAGDAQWFFGWAYPGDIVTITGTKRKLAWTNGWGYWQLPFGTWTQGGALKKPVTTAPHTAAPAAGASPTASPPVTPGA
ncbi:L,D-transpeptidase family protein [Actinomadura sp. PM05-2]|uniref:L,D-transpeptidase family protein n=1 Tax=Actinomadura parmotrematis TaxID=2864039 RepID=A0ABS7G2G8_9ACTN|nr:L,D-transpeptidase family protein [Actinomadura parmotrematis]